MEIRQVHVTRYVTPLREGGSLPAIAEADDNFLYVLKFRGAGQGARSLISELIGGPWACVFPKLYLPCSILRSDRYPQYGSAMFKSASGTLRRTRSDP